MKQLPCCAAFVTCLWLGSNALCGDDSTTIFKAGFAERDISPEIGMEQPGGYGKSYHTSFHDPCKVRACVFDDGQNSVALVGLDALFIHRETVNSVRQKIAERTTLEPTSILLAASHSHSSGPMSGIMPGQYDDAPELVRKLAYDHSTAANADYLQRVEQGIVDAVCDAFESRVDAQAGVGRGSEDSVAFNRRFRMRSGLTVTHPRQGNPDIIEPAGPADPEVGVMGVWSVEGKYLGCIVNFACHATTSPGGISANYIYYLEEVIRGLMGEDSVVVFLNGASGDITQVDNLSPYVFPAAEEWARLVGGRVGAEAAKVLVGMTPGKLTPIQARVKVLEVPRRVPDPQRVEAAIELAQMDPSKADPTEWAFAKEIVLLDWLIKKSPRVEAEIQVIQVGPVVFVSDPAEYFVEYGLFLKKNSAFPFTFPVSLANGCVGYVPTAEAFGPRGGGYETRLTSYSNLIPTAGQLFADTGIELSRELIPGALPQRPTAPVFEGLPWTYGNVPPELN